MVVDRYTEYLKELENLNGVRFERLVAICETLFGRARTKGSHYIYKMPWFGDPRINLQRDGRDAKPYQVRQVIRAITKLERMHATRQKKK